MMLEAALEYARQGFRVFPCKAWNPGCDGNECDCKHPLTVHGFKEASCDEEKVRRWWRLNPDANIAVATGDPGIDVLDVDVHSGDGYQSFAIACRAGLVRDWMAVVSTPSGGTHVWFRGTAQRNGSLRRRNLDYRGTGGYVLVPPSRVHGGCYEFREKPWGWGTLSWLAVRELLDPRPPQPPALRGNPTSLANYVMHLEPGMRNNGFYWACRRAAEEGVTDLSELERAACAIGLAERDIAATAASAVRGRM